MNRSNILRPLLIAILVILAASWFRFRHTSANQNQPEIAAQRGQAHQHEIPAGARLVYTKHARCRMDCRHITEAEVQEVLTEGVVNEAKSDRSDSPCPTYALEDHTREGQHLRIVFARCDNVVKVVTCIDLDQDFECHCE